MRNSQRDPFCWEETEVTWDQPFFHKEFPHRDRPGTTLHLPHSSADWFMW